MEKGDMLTGEINAIIQNIGKFYSDLLTSSSPDEFPGALWMFWNPLDWIKAPYLAAPFKVAIKSIRSHRISPIRTCNG